MDEGTAEGYFQEFTSVVHFVSEERIAALMHGAGFEGVERFYGAMLFGGWVARRSSGGEPPSRGRA